MARVDSNVPKFKRIEAKIREAANAQREAIAEIDDALAVKRSDNERQILAGIRRRIADCHANMRQVHHDFFVAVDTQLSA